jgi:hypothetical protein
VLFTSAEGIRVGELIEYLITLPTAMNGNGAVRLRCHGKVVRQEGSLPTDGMGIAATVERYEFLRGRSE